MHDTFGNETVTPDERKQRISKVFAAVAGRYDLMNDLMSFGIHRLWKRRLVSSLTLRPHSTVVDLAGGTGDVARAINKKYNKNNNIILVIDASWPMMATGRTKGTNLTHWVAAEGEKLPLADNTIDLVTLSFGLRNMTNIQACLTETLRCLKPGGQLVCLEFSTPVFWLKPFYDLYSRFVIPRLGALVAGEPAAYQYLIDSIRKFPNQQELSHIFEQTGFTDVTFKNLSFGISALHYGTKPVDTAAP